MIISNIEVSCINKSNEKDKVVYGIFNKISNKYYIGSTINKLGIRCRIRRHIYQLNKNNHHSAKLQNSFNKYNKDFSNWEFIILGKVDNEDYQIKEQFYIDKYNSYYNGYNSTKYSDKIFCNKMSDKHKKAISDSKQKLTEIDVIDIFNNYNNGLNYVEISKIYNISYVTISTIINNDKYYTNIKNKNNLKKNYYNYIFYNIKENKFYKVDNFSYFCKDKSIKRCIMMSLYSGRLKKPFVDEWTIFNKENFSLLELRNRISRISKEFILYKNGEKIIFYNVVDFCIKNNLDNSKIYNVLKGKIKYKEYSNENN